MGSYWPRKKSYEQDFRWSGGQDKRNLGEKDAATKCLKTEINGGRSINSDVLTLILTRCSDCEEQLRVTFRPETVALASDDSAI